MDTSLMPIPMQSQSQVKTRVGKNVTAMAQWAQRDEKKTERLLFISIPYVVFTRFWLNYSFYDNLRELFLEFEILKKDAPSDFFISVECGG